MQEVISKIQMHIPYHLWPQHQADIIGNKLNPEIYFSSEMPGLRLLFTPLLWICAPARLMTKFDASAWTE